MHANSRFLVRTVLLAAALGVLSTSFFARPAEAVPIEGGLNNVPITQVVIDDNGTIVTQNAETNVNTGANTPAELLEVSVNDGGQVVVLDEFRDDFSVTNINYPAAATGVSVWQNGIATPSGDPNFPNVVGPAIGPLTSATTSPTTAPGTRSTAPPLTST